MGESETRVIGYFGYLFSGQPVCTGDACVVSGSGEAMERYLTEAVASGVADATVRKTRFGDVLEGLELGAAYAFDRESYARFYPLACDAGLPVATPAEFEASGKRFVVIRLAAD